MRSHLALPQAATLLLPLLAGQALNSPLQVKQELPLQLLLWLFTILRHSLLLTTQQRLQQACYVLLLLLLLWQGS